LKGKLEHFLRSKVKNPSSEEINEVLDLFEPMHFKKKDFIKKPFTISKELGFIVKGNVRAVFTKKSGDETTFRILGENSFVADVHSARTNQKTPIGMECLDDVSLLMAPLSKVYNLLESNLALNIVLREYVTENALEIGKKYLQFLTGTAKERYQFILENDPKLLEQFPLRHIASLIGVTPTQLSRIRSST